jgi:hypothetical protein
MIDRFKLIFFTAVLVTIPGFIGAQTFNFFIANDHLVSPSVFEFSVYIQPTSTDFLLRTIQLSFTINPAFCPSGNAPTIIYVAGSTQLNSYLPGSILQNSSPSLSAFQIGGNFAGTCSGNGTFINSITNLSGLRIATFRITSNSGSFNCVTENISMIRPSDTAPGGNVNIKTAVTKWNTNNCTLSTSSVISTNGTYTNYIANTLYETVNNMRPIIITQPILTNFSGGRTFSVVAVGNSAIALPLSFQWMQNGSLLSDGTTSNGTYSGCNTSSLSIVNPQTSLNGSLFSVNVTQCNSRSSSNTIFAVFDPNGDDNNLCTNDAFNSSSGIFTHTLFNIDDNNVCTVDACDPLTGIISHTMNLDDGFLCSIDICDPIEGIYHNFYIDDGNACTMDACDVLTGIVTHAQINVNDNNACTTDACNNLTGIFHTPLNTNDNNACTTDACDPATGIITHVALNIDDHNGCTVDGCNPGSGVFHNYTVNVDDGNFCTDDACDAAGNIIHTYPPAFANDNNACTLDACNSVTGVTHTSINTDDGNSCTVDGCDPITGIYHLSYSFNPPSLSISSAGGTYNFSVTPLSACSTWVAITSQSWIHTSSFGTGNGLCNYSVDQNIGSTRTGDITIGVQSFSIIQSGSSMIWFYNRIVDNALFSVPQLMVSAPISNIVSPFKVCADGSQATFIEFKNDDPSISNSNIQFRIKEDPLKLYTNVYGSFELAINVNSDIRKVYYNHPTFMNDVAISKRCTLEVINQGNNDAVIAAYPIDIYRAPVLFIHGLWGDNTSLKNLEASLYDSGLYPPAPYIKYNSLSTLTLRADYEATNDVHFAQNQNVVPMHISQLLSQVVNSGISTGKVDLICHSMGGILARQYLNGKYQSYRNDIHKLITFNTPHKGTQLANYLLSFEGSSARSLLLWSAAYNSNNGAVDDLSVNNPEIAGLNSLVQQPNKVPSHAIATTGYSIGNVKADLVRGILSSAIFCHNIYKSHLNDLIVPLESQECGIFQSTNPVANDQWHVGSCENPDIFISIRDLIDADPQSVSFTSNGFGLNSLLDVPTLSCNLSSTSQAFQNQTSVSISDSVQINSPYYGEVFASGDSIQINISSTGNVSKMLFFVGNERTEYFEIDTDLTFINWKINLSDNIFGKLHILVLGFNNNNDLICFDSSFVSIQPTATIDSINIIPDSISMPIYSQQSFSILGYYSDGVTRDITNNTSINILTDTSIVKIIRFNSIQSISSVDTVLTVGIGNMIARSKLHIYQDSSLYVAIFNSNVNSVCRFDTIKYFDYSYGLPTSRNWFFPGGNPSSSTLKNPVIEYDSSGVFDVILIENWSTHTDTLIFHNYVSVGICPLLVSLKLYIQGLYKSSGEMINSLYLLGLNSDSTVCDSVELELHYSTAPFDLAYTSKSLVKTNGKSEFKFSNVIDSSYYLVIRYKNAINTWSSYPININTDSIYFNFSSSQSSAFGNNLFQFADGNYAIWSGDVNQDQYINAGDYSQIESGAINLQYGYRKEDLTGDGMIDATDYSIIENNIYNYINVQKP